MIDQSSKKWPACIKPIHICGFSLVRTYSDICSITFLTSEYIQIFVRSILGHSNIVGYLFKLILWYLIITALFIAKFQITSIILVLGDWNQHNKYFRGNAQMRLSKFLVTIKNRGVEKILTAVYFLLPLFLLIPLEAFFINSFWTIYAI